MGSFYLYLLVILCINQHTKFEVSSFTNSKDMIDGKTGHVTLTTLFPGWSVIRRLEYQSTCVQNCITLAWYMVGAHQNLNGSRDLTTPRSRMICHPQAVTCCYESAYQIRSIHRRPPRRYKKIQNLKNWMVWASYGSRMVTENSAIR